MTLPNWGALEKAVDDSQTITEAIAAAISAHADDPEAHTLTGQSVHSHKIEPVIDHVKGSVLPDKVSFNDLSFDTTFESMTPFSVSAHCTAQSFPGCSMSFYDGGHDIEYLKANFLGILTGTSFAFDFLMDLYFYLDTEDTDFVARWGVMNNAMSTLHLGFKVEDGNIYGVARWGSAEHLTASLHTVSSGALVFCRVFYDYAGGKIYFYVNGEEKATLSPSSAVSLDNQIALHVDAGTEESGVWRIYRMSVSRSL